MRTKLIEDSHCFRVVTDNGYYQTVHRFDKQEHNAELRARNAVAFYNEAHDAMEAEEKKRNLEFTGE